MASRTCLCICIRQPYEVRWKPSRTGGHPMPRQKWGVVCVTRAVGAPRGDTLGCAATSRLSSMVSTRVKAVR